MKTKDLVIGKEYVLGNRARYGYRAVRAILLSKDRYKVTGSGSNPLFGGARMPSHAPVETALGERGGLCFAVLGWQGYWVPQILQPNSVFAAAEDYDKAKAERDAQDLAQQEARREEQAARHREYLAAQEARKARQTALNQALVARGLPEASFDRFGQQEHVFVDIEFLEQVIRRLRVKS